MDINTVTVTLICISLLIFGYGLIRRKHINIDKRKDFIRKNVALGVIPIIFMFLIYQPNPIPMIEIKQKMRIEESKDKKANKIELENEIVNMKMDLFLLERQVVAANTYYRILITILLSGLMGCCIAMLSKKKEE